MIGILEWLNQPQKLYLAIVKKYYVKQSKKVVIFVEKKLKSGFTIKHQDIKETNDKKEYKVSGLLYPFITPFCCRRAVIQ